jgi:hypothetical protein
MSDALKKAWNQTFSASLSGIPGVDVGGDSRHTGTKARECLASEQQLCGFIKQRAASTELRARHEFPNHHQGEADKGFSGF